MQLPSYLTALLLLLPSFPTNSTAPLDPPLPLVAPIASPHPHYLSSPHAFNPHPHGHVPPKHAHKHARHALSPARLHARGQTWVSQGCVSDGPARALPAYFAQLDHLSIAVCTSACAAAGYTYAGLEYGQECHCDNALQNGLGTPIDPGNCNMACDGDGAENCGGSYAMELYHLQDAAAGGAGWSSVGCAVDSANRVLAGTSTSDSNGMTLESCESFCKGYAYMGVENGDECYCGNTLVGGFVSGGGCSTPCAGNGQETCGGGWRLSVYSSGSPSPTSTSTSTSTSPTSTSAPPATSGWVSLGCVSDGPARALPAYFAQLDDLTVASCTARCSAAGYTYAGLEYGQECHCDNSLQNGLGTALAAGSCNMACDGDATELCGGNYAMNLWQLKAGTSTSTSTSSSASTRASTTTTSSTSTSTSTSAAATS
ncbi:WSC-domain-containing protein, partial [Calocera cornea HHB12733]